MNSFYTVRWHWPAKYIAPLAKALERKSVAVDKKKIGLDNLRLVTLHFDGEMEPRDTNGKRTFKGKLFEAVAGDVVYSKIDVRNGAIGVVPPEMPKVAVSSEYPVYRVRPEVALPEYVKLLFRTNAFRRQIGSMISGASGRKRVQPSDLEEIDVPLPPLWVQQGIVEHWSKAQEKAAELWAHADRVEARIEGMLLSKLGVPDKAAELLPRVFALRWADLERWSLDYLRRALTVGKNLAKAEYPLETLGEIAAVSYGLQKCPSNRPGKNARPYLRVANVQAGELDLSEIKYIDVPDSMMDAYRLEPEDLLVCEGNSADLVGRPAIWSGEIPDCVHQNHVLKVRLDKAKALPRFVLEYMHTFPARSYLRARAKFTTNLASLNSSDLRQLPIPVPPMALQESIVADVQQRRVEVAAARDEAQQLAEQMKAEVEAMILGKRPVRVHS